MNEEEQIKFVEELINNVKDNITNDLHNHRELVKEWDGIELRWYIAEKFNQCIIKSMGSRSRKIKYNNALLLLP